MRFRTSLIIIFFLLDISYAPAFGVLTHEAIVDAAWESSITPLLKKRFPTATADDLNKAHAYAYGGAIMPDMGYFPLGSTFFTNLLHYVRSGDFVMNLLSEAHDLNELAFALGALAHYNADKDGHPESVNLCVGMMYPKVQKEFGDTISFIEDPIAHRRTEFGFDVLQVARGKYAPKSYHDFIGFMVAQSLMERAFLITYGISLKDIYIDLPLSINTFRWSVKTFMPNLTNAAWMSKKNEVEKSQPGITKKQFKYGLSKSKYHEEWGKKYKKPGLGAYTIAVIIKVIPKVGIVRILKFKSPTQPAEELFIKSFNDAVSDYSLTLKKVGTHSLHLDNINFDTGKKTSPCVYSLVDDTYKELLLKLPLQPVNQADKYLRKNIMEFYKTFSPGFKNEKEERQCMDAFAWLLSGE